MVQNYDAKISRCYRFTSRIDLEILDKECCSLIGGQLIWFDNRTFFKFCGCWISGQLFVLNKKASKGRSSENHKCENYGKL